MTAFSPASSAAVRRLVLLAWAAIVTLTMQQWVGAATIYRPDRAPRVEAAHRALLTNAPIDGKPWSANGLNATNIRVVAPFLAEGLHRATGMPVPRAYWLLDTVALFAALVLIVWFLRQVAPDPYALVGALYVTTMLPLTYQLFFYHPWDRLALVAWLLLLGALRAERLALFAALLPVAVAVKYDAVLLPGLFFLATVRRDTLLPVVLRTMALFALSFGTYALLLALRPGGSDPKSIAGQLTTNVRVLLELKLFYPPFLGLALPALLAIIGFGDADRFARAGVVFAALMMVVFALQSNLAEFRAHLPVLLLLLPAALVGLRRLVVATPDAAPRGAAAPLTAP